MNRIWPIGRHLECIEDEFYLFGKMPLGSDSVGCEVGHFGEFYISKIPVAPLVILISTNHCGLDR